MNKKDLEELKEITGLTTEKELSASVSVNASAPSTSIKPRTYDRMPYNKELVGYVGMFVKVGNSYGIIDDVHGNRLGFVHSDKDSWTGEIVNEGDVSICKSHDDMVKAYNSALNYFKREKNSLESRMKAANRFDDQARISHEAWKVGKWIEKLEAMAA